MTLKVRKAITSGLPVTLTHNDVARDLRLSHAARGLLLYIQSLPDGWEFSIEELYQDKSETHPSFRRTAAQRVMRELTEYGYAELIKNQLDDGTFAGSYYEVDGYPDGVPQSVLPTVGKPASRSSSSPGDRKPASQYRKEDYSKKENNKDAKASLENGVDSQDEKKLSDWQLSVGIFAKMMFIQNPYEDVKIAEHQAKIAGIWLSKIKKEIDSDIEWSQDSLLGLWSWYRHRFGADAIFPSSEYAKVYKYFQQFALDPDYNKFIIRGSISPARNPEPAAAENPHPLQDSDIDDLIEHFSGEF